MASFNIRRVTQSDKPTEFLSALLQRVIVSLKSLFWLCGPQLCRFSSLSLLSATSFPASAAAAVSKEMLYKPTLHTDKGSRTVNFGLWFQMNARYGCVGWVNRKLFASTFAISPVYQLQMVICQCCVYSILLLICVLQLISVLCLWFM